MSSFFRNCFDRQLLKLITQGCGNHLENKMKKLILTLALLSSSTMANALTYNDVKALTPGRPDLAFHIYAFGVIDESLIHKVFCPPEGAPYDQSIAIAKKYIDEHPEQWGYQANNLISFALHNAFPCPPKTKTSTDPKF